jgi:hypothetical protein
MASNTGSSGPVDVTYCKNFASAESKSVTWDKLVENLTRSVEYPTKEASKARGAFIGGVLKDPTRNRADDNIAFRTCITVDIDQVIMPIGDIELFLRMELAVAFIAYSTYRHTDAEPRIRIVIPLSRPVNQREYRAIMDQIAKILEPIGVLDKCSWVWAQLMFLPSHQPGVTPWSVVQGGEPWQVPDVIDGVDYAEVTVDNYHSSGGGFSTGNSWTTDQSSGISGQSSNDDGVADLELALAQRPLDLTPTEVNTLLERWPAANLDYDGWNEVGMAIYHQFEGSDEGYEIWKGWSEKSPKHDPREMRMKWRSFGGRARPKTMRTIIKLVGGMAPVSRAQSVFSSEDHPLLKFTPYDGCLPAPRMIVPGLVEQGTCVIAGQAGIGKTTAIMALVCTVAGIHRLGDPLAPKHWRHVVVISEDTNQVKRCLYAIEQEFGCSQEIKDRIHIVDAARMPIDEFVKVGLPYQNMFTVDADGVQIPPLVICDTKAAIFASTDENDNAETSAMMAGLKQNFSGLPVWIIGHVSKSNLNRTSAKDFTLRGASSAEGDANQTMFLVRDEDGRRFLVLGKTRFEPDWRDVELRSFVSTAIATDDFGDMVPISLRRVALCPLTEGEKAERAAAVKAEKEAEKRREEDERNAEIKIWAIDVVKKRRLEQDPLNRTALKKELYENLGVSKGPASILINQWMQEGILGEVEIPAAIAANNNKRKFLIELTENERAEWFVSKTLPAEKSTVPDSWKKSGRAGK